jgi:hypothetical protein
MPLKNMFLQHPERRYTMFGGKGLLGKTTSGRAETHPSGW